MALLHRFSKLNDRSNTGIFTFIVTRSVTRDLHRDATTKDFYYGYHRWAISFTRANDKVLGVYLILRDTSPLAITYTDYSITLLNRIHFSRNEQYGEKQCKFSSDHPAHGINKWIPLGDIQTRNFGDETGEFLLELNLSNLMTVFETQICLHSLAGSGGQNGGGNPGGQTSSAPSNNPANPPAPTFKNGKLETSYFHYGTFEWNISILMHNASSGGAASMVRGLFKDSSNSQDQEPLFNARNANSGQGGAAGSKSNRSYLLFLNRLTGFENACRIQYRIVLGQDQLREDTGLIEQMSDMNGRTRGYQIDQHTFAQLTSMGMVNLYFEFYCCNPISEAKVPITRSISPTINCYDRNKQGWSIESDVEGEHLKLKLYFMDMHSVPRNHLRYVSWFTYVIVNQDSSSTSSSTAAASSGSNQTGSGSGPLGSNNVMVKNSPHYNYYIQDGIDMGVVMETDILVADIKSSGKKYLENETNLTVHVEWYDSIMLFNHIYHKYDDIARMHCHQMRREISALSSENYSLERQIFAYQRSISMANNQINVQTNSMARLSISSPSKPAPPTSINHCGGGQSGGTGFGSPSSSSSAAAAAAVAAAAAYHRSSNPQLDSSYFNATDEISSISGGSDGGSAGGGYYLSDHHQSHRRPETINYATTGPDRTMGGTPLATSPMQPPPQQQQQPSLAQYLGSTLDGCTPAISTRHSFSGPATPQHHAQYLSHHHHRQQQQQQQQQSQLVQTPSLSPYVTTPGGGYHHQLAQAGAAGAGQMSYTTTTGYRLRSPSSNPNIAQMYHQDDLGMAQSTAGAGGMVMDATDDGSVDDAYQAYSGRYKLTV